MSNTLPPLFLYTSNQQWQNLFELLAMGAQSYITQFELCIIVLENKDKVILA